MLDVMVAGRLPAGFSRKDAARLAGAAFRRAGARGAAELAITMIDDRRMRALNKAHRGKNATTDVLSFGQPSPKELPGEGRGIVRQLGDIFISLPQVRRQAAAIGRPVPQEFALMVVHGVLHLLGHDHETLAQERRMFSLQHDILSQEGYF